MRTDGTSHESMFCVGGRLRYYADIRNIASEYLRECDEFMRINPRLGAELDKPNAHRAMELAVHTIPTFGHARNCSEMILECMHQVFKTSLEKSVHQNSHISAVERALMRDRCGRVYALFKIWEGGTSRVRACTEVGLRRLLLGEEFMHMDEDQPEMTELKKVFEDSMRQALRRPVAEMMGRHSHISLPGARKSKWIVQHMHIVQLTENMENLQLVRKGRSLLRQHYKLRAGYDTQLMRMYTVARLQHADVYEGVRGNSYSYNEVCVGSVISCPHKEGKDILPSGFCGEGRLNIYAVVMILCGPDDKLWVTAVPMEKSSNSTRAMDVAQNKCALVELSSCVRRAGACHLCDSNCRHHPSKLEVEHSAGILQGGLYNIWTRRDNYPPYMG